MAHPRGAQQQKGKKIKRKRFGTQKKVCRFCVDKIDGIDYKDVKTIRGLTTERGKLIPSRVSGNCARHQRQVASAVKRARYMALLPYVTERSV